MLVGIYLCAKLAQKGWPIMATVTRSRPHRKHVIAKRLTEAMEHLLEFEYEPKEINDAGDPDSRGHMFQAVVNEDISPVIDADDRHGPLGPQVSAELRAQAKRLSALADKLDLAEAAAGKVVAR